MSLEVSGSSLGREIEAEKGAYKISKEQQRAIKCTEKSSMNSVNNDHKLIVIFLLSNCIIPITTNVCFQV